MALDYQTYLQADDIQNRIWVAQKELSKLSKTVRKKMSQGVSCQKDIDCLILSVGMLESLRCYTSLDELYYGVSNV